MKKIKNYEPAEIELVYFELRDVLTTSLPGESAGGGETTDTPTWDKEGWT